MLTHISVHLIYANGHQQISHAYARALLMRDPEFDTENL